MNPITFISGQFSRSVVSDSLRPHGLQHTQASLSITKSQSLLKVLSIESVITSSHLILCHPLLLPSIFHSIRVFSNETFLCVRWLKYWSFSFNINPYNEHSELISFRMDWLGLLAVQGTLKSLLQHHSSKETDANLPLSVQESPAEGWVGSGWRQCWGHSVSSRFSAI